MTTLQTHHEGDARCNNQFQITKSTDALESACLSQIVQPFRINKNRLKSLALQDMSFSTSVTLGLLLIVTFYEKNF